MLLTIQFFVKKHQELSSLPKYTRQYQHVHSGCDSQISTKIVCLQTRGVLSLFVSIRGSRFNQAEGETMVRPPFHIPAPVLPCGTEPRRHATMGVVVEESIENAPQVPS